MSEIYKGGKRILIVDKISKMPTGLLKCKSTSATFGELKFKIELLSEAMGKAHKEAEEAAKNFNLAIAELTAKTLIELPKIKETKEKHFEKFNYKMKRGKRKWR